MLRDFLQSSVTLCISFHDNHVMIASQVSSRARFLDIYCEHENTRYENSQLSSFFSLIRIILHIYGSGISLCYTARFLSERTGFCGLHLEGISSQRRGELRNTRVQFRTALSPRVPYNRAGSPGYKTETRGPCFLAV